MFALPRHPYAAPYHAYNPYEELIIEQELQRRRRAEVYQRRQQEMEGLNRRRQYEHALRQAELERQRQMAMTADQERCRPVMRNGMEGLLEMLYGGRAAPPPFCYRRSPTPEHRSSQEPSVEQSDIPQTQESTLDSPDTTSSTESAEHAEATPATPAAQHETEKEESSEALNTYTSASLAAVAGILSMFVSLQSEFTFPTQLDFLASSSSSSPKLAYTSSNAPLHQYEHVLTGLLTRLDAVESYGDDEVRKARKEAVKGIEKELAGLDERKTKEWERQNVPEVEQDTQGLENPEIQGEAIPMEVDSSTVPLPDDSEDDTETNELPQPFATVSPTVALSSDGTTSQGDRDDEHEADETGEATPVSSVDDPLPASQSPDHVEALPTTGTVSEDVSLNEASSSDESDSEVEEYVDVEADMMSGTEMGDDSDETEEAEVEGAKELVGIDEWEMDF